MARCSECSRSPARSIHVRVVPGPRALELARKAARVGGGLPERDCGRHGHGQSGHDDMILPFLKVV